MTRPTTAADIFTQLKAPFHSKDIEWKLGGTNQDKTKGRALPYLKFQAVADRLDQVLGEMNWLNTYVSGPAGGVVCRLSLRIENEWLCKENGAGNTDKEGVKGGLSDAFKRAATMFGVGRYLHSYDAILVDLTEHGRWVAPALPDEFLPTDEVEQRRKDYEAYEAEVAAGRVGAAAAPAAETPAAEASAGVDAAPAVPATEEKPEFVAKATRSRSTAKSAQATPAETAQVDAAEKTASTAPETVAEASSEQGPEHPAAAPAVDTAVETVVELPAEQPAETAAAASTATAESTLAPTAGPEQFNLDEKGYPIVPGGLPEGEVKLLTSLVARVAKAEQLDPVRDYLENGKGRTALCDIARQYLFAYVNREEAVRKEAAAAAA